MTNAQDPTKHHSLSPTGEDLANADAQQLRATVERFQRIHHGSACGFWEWDLQLDRLYWDGGFWESLGYTAEKRFAVQAGPDIFAYVHPDDIAKIEQAIEQHIRSAEPYYAVYRIRRADDSYCWTEARGNSRRAADGKVHFISGINIDISALKDAEQRLRESEARHERILKASNDGIWEWRRNDKAMDFSARCWEMLGYQESFSVRPDRNRLQVWYDLMHPDDLERFKSTLAEHIASGQPFDIEYRMKAADGSYHWIKGRGSVALDEQGQVLSMAGSNLDITALKEAETKVLKALTAAERANRAKSEFLSSMSHELRTPLNAIMGFAQLFDYDSNLTSDQQENIREIRKAGTHLLQLINDVLDLAKIESGKLTLSLEPVLPARVVRECVQLMQSLAESRAIKISQDLRRWAGCYIQADAVRLKQVLLNLLSNAIKYNRMGGSVEVIFQAEGSDKLRIGVRDTGAGIPESRRREMFQPFSRLGAEGGKIEGSGVGLVITQRLMEMMGGSIDFESRPGAGTTFWLTFQQVETPSQPEVPQTHTPLTRAQLNISRPHKVLYIEDNPSNIRVIRQFFSRYELVQLEVAEEAFLGLYKARTFEPDVILLDINLPGMDGYEVLEVLKTDTATSDVPVLALSANAMSYDIERGMQAGFYEYLTKPVDINALIGVLNRIIS